MNRKGLLLALLSLSVLSIFAQGSIEGILKNEKGEPLSYANVILKQDSINVTGASTDIDGFYFIDNIKAGEYELVVQYQTNFSNPETIKIKDRETYAYNVAISDANSIKPIIVLGKRLNPLMDKFEPAVDITTYKILNETKPKTITQAIQTTTIVQQDKEGNLSFRGSRPGQGAYYVDGTRIAGNLDIPTNSIYTLKVYSAGIPAKYGNTTSAVIVIDTKSYFDFFE